MADNREAFRRSGVTYFPYVELPGHPDGLLDLLAPHAAIVVCDDYPAFTVNRLTEAVVARIPVRFERCQRQRDPPGCARSFPNALCGTRSTRHPRAERRALQPRSSGVAGTCQQRQSWLVGCVGERLGFNPCVQRPADDDRFEPPPSWALTTLGHHVTDTRPVTYSLEQFEAAETHDALGPPPRAS